MNVVRHVAAVALIAATVGTAAALSSPAGATGSRSGAAVSAAAAVAPAGRTLVRCNDSTAGYNKCAAARRALIHEKTRVSPLYHNVWDCTAPGCIPGWYFYYYV